MNDFKDNHNSDYPTRLQKKMHLLLQTFVDTSGHTQLFGHAGNNAVGLALEEEEDEPEPCCTAVSAAIFVDRLARVLFPLLFATVMNDSSRQVHE
jgi:hypothetical protein